MNFHRPTLFAVAARWFCAALTVVVFSGAVHAEPAVSGRWLLIFDTSPAMKKCLPATTAAVSQLLGTSADGQIQNGDSVAGWVYGRQMLPSQLPPVAWDATLSRLMSSNLVAFIERQGFQAESKLAALQAPLTRVIRDSERLTIVIFCDGQSEISATPYDEGINQSFRDAQAERKKNQQPFVLVLRTQLGKYVGCTVNYPPGIINFPPFPDLPTAPPVQVVVAPTNTKAVNPPPGEVPSLVIVGSKVGTNLNTPPPLAPPVAGTNVPAPEKPAAPVVNPLPTNPPAAPVAPPPVKVEKVELAPVPPPAKPAPPTATNAAAIIAPVTNQPALKPVVTQAVAAAVIQPTASAPVTAVAPGRSHQRMGILIAVGVGLLLTAIVLVGVLVSRLGRRPHSSLITRSMQDEPRRK